MHIMPCEDRMKVILRKDFSQLGQTGDILEVKNGYARNYLIPQGIAVLATPKNMKSLEEEQRLSEIRMNKDRKNAEILAKELETVSLTVAVAVGEEDRVFGSVTAQNIADKLKEKNYNIDKKKISLKEPIKALGIYNVSIKLHTDVEAGIRVWVVKE
jgi:large subunit ribosomal protein L9